MRSREYQRLSDHHKSVISTFAEAIPVKLGGLARSFGLAVKLSSLPAGISGEIKPDPENQGRYLIKINRHETRFRQRFTLAHQIAHYLLHEDLIGNGIEDSVLYKSKLPDALEHEAHRLAADLITPVRSINREMAAYIGEPNEEIIEALANTFQVGKSLMEIRIALQ